MLHFQDQFQCSTGICIWDTWVCDNDFDCPGKEDEENCSKKTCAAHHEFQCRHSSGCISNTLLCNGHNDCADGYVHVLLFYGSEFFMVWKTIYEKLS